MQQYSARVKREVHGLIRRTCQGDKGSGALHKWKQQPDSVKAVVRQTLEEIATKKGLNVGFLKWKARRYVQHLHNKHSRPGDPDLLQLAYMRARRKTARKVGSQGARKRNGR